MHLRAVVGRTRETEGWITLALDGYPRRWSAYIAMLGLMGDNVDAVWQAM